MGDSFHCLLDWSQLLYLCLFFTSIPCVNLWNSYLMICRVYWGTCFYIQVFSKVITYHSINQFIVDKCTYHHINHILIIIIIMITIIIIIIFRFNWKLTLRDHLTIMWPHLTPSDPNPSISFPIKPGYNHPYTISLILFIFLNQYTFCPILI